MLDVRIRNQISDDELQLKVGKVLDPSDVNLLVTGEAIIRRPDGRTLAVLLKRALAPELIAGSYDTLHSLRSQQTTNRGHASGTLRVKKSAGSRTYTKPVSSAILGAFDAVQPYRYCRLTAWTGVEMDRYRELWPLFQAIGALFEEHVPERYAAQQAAINRTHPDWVIEGTPFSTITVNNTYPTGVHCDAGDLVDGFGNLAVIRRGRYSGGWLCFPRYRVGVDMEDGDVLLMDVHEWHGNTALELESEDAERISIVCYMRADITKCGSQTAEAARAVRARESRFDKMPAVTTTAWEGK